MSDYDFTKALKDQVTAGYVGAYKSIYEDEKKKRKAAENKVAALEAILEIMTAERDFWKSKCEPETDNIN